MSGEKLRAIYIEIGHNCFLEIWQGSFVIGFKGPEDALKKIKEALSDVEVLTSSTILQLIKENSSNVDSSWIDRLFGDEGKEEDLRNSFFANKEI